MLSVQTSVHLTVVIVAISVSRLDLVGLPGRSASGAKSVDFRLDLIVRLDGQVDVGESETSSEQVRCVLVRVQVESVRTDGQEL